jgi:predicted glycosyltransferase
LGLTNEEIYSVLRFVSWNASHDRGHAGMPLDRKRDLVALLTQYGKVVISSEAPLPDEFEPHRVSVSAHRMHDLLAAASLYVGEGATMASEAAILGTPAIYTNSLSLGYLEDQEMKYGLVHNLPDSESTMAMTKELLERPDGHAEFVKKRDEMLADTIDVTEFICEEVERILSSQVSRDVESPAGQAATEDRV